jgi:hypothetical protein
MIDAFQKPRLVTILSSDEVVTITIVTASGEELVFEVTPKLVVDNANQQARAGLTYKNVTPPDTFPC